MLPLHAWAVGLANGVGLRPPMGYSSWNDCASEVTEARIRRVARALVNTGLAAKGYTHVNVDEGWLKSRGTTTLAMEEDTAKFPSGMRALGEWVHAQEVPGAGRTLRYGLYTSRGTCQCSTKQYQGPGSSGHIERDAAWMVAAGADLVKVDSCCGSQQREAAMGDYAAFRDALNATGRPVFLAVCGWNAWYARRGHTLGHSWRIALDGTNWGALSHCANVNARLSKHASPGGWNDPDLLQGTGKGSNDLPSNPHGCFDPSRIPQSRDWYLSERQVRAQMTLWAVMSAPLIISADPSQVEPSVLATWGNEEVISVNQELRDGGPYQGHRLAGLDLHYDAALKAGSGTNVWGKPLPAGALALAFINNGPNATDVVCDRSCYGPLAGGSARAYALRNLWARADLGAFSPPQTLVAKAVAAHGGAAMLRLTPLAAGQASSRHQQLRGGAFEWRPCREASPTGDWGGQCGGAKAVRGGSGKRRPKLRRIAEGQA